MWCQTTEHGGGRRGRTTTGIYAGVFWVEPAVKLPVAKRHADIVVVLLYFRQDFFIRRPHGLVAKGIVVVSAVVRPETNRGVGGVTELVSTWFAGVLEHTVAPCHHAIVDAVAG